jgi:glutamyl-tRNA reductase
MSVLTVGLSHRSAPVSLLERVVQNDDGVVKLLADLHAADHVDEAVVLSTCNRLEVYADVRKFHGGVQEVTECISARAGVPVSELAEHLYVHYEDRAVQHLFSVASGLESMVVGEHQILGQLRTALQMAREEASVGRTLGLLMDNALHAGKRAHAETGLDNAGKSLVSVALELAAERLGGLTDKSAVLVGAGSMSALAGTTLRRHGIGHLVIVNRSADRADRLAQSLPAKVATPAELIEVIADADLVVSCTGAVGTVVSFDAVSEALARRPDRPLAVIDLALPRDVEPEVRTLAGVTMVDLEALHAVLESADIARDVEAARRIVTDEVGAFLAKQRSERVAPTVVALRARAQEVVDAELQRLRTKAGLDERLDREVTATVNRVVDKILHTPTARVKELAEAPGGDSYAEALRELFALDPAATEVVTRADVVIEDTDDGPAS